MSREEYLNQLAYLLSDIPDEEREEAMEFYRDYFEEAGEGQEDSVVSELGSPEKVAAQIKSSLLGDNGSFGSYTESGYQDERFRENNKVPVPGTPGEQGERREKERESEKEQNHTYRTYNGQQGYGPGGYRTFGNRPYYRRPERRRSGLTIALIVMVCIFASPVLLSLAGVAVAGLFSVLALIFSAAFGVLAATLGALVSGVALIICGVVSMWSSPPVGCLLLGVGLLAMAVGFLLILADVWMIGKFVPWAIRGVVNLCSRIFRRGGRRS